MKTLLKKIFSLKILCFILLFVEFAVVVVAWAFIEFRFVDYAAQGVKVRVVYDDIVSMGVVKNNMPDKLQECGITYLDAPCIPEIKADFEEMMSVSEKIPSDFKMKGFPRFLAGILKMFRVLF